MPRNIAHIVIEDELRARTGSLDLGNCGLAEVPRVVWEEMPWLESLNFSHNYVAFETDEWVFSENGGLENNLVRLPDSIPNLPKLKFLEISGWLVSMDLFDLGPVSHLKSLEYLGCRSTDVRSLEPLRDLTHLRILDLAHLMVDDLEPLRNLTELTRLGLYRTSAHDLSPLAGMRNLVYLDCSYTQVQDLRPLAGLRGLRSLDISSTKIQDLEPLLGMLENEEVDLTKGTFSPEPGISILNLEFAHPPQSVVDKGKNAVLEFFAGKS